MEQDIIIDEQKIYPGNHCKGTKKMENKSYIMESNFFTDFFQIDQEENIDFL